MARKKKKEEKPHSVYAGYAGVISRFLDVTGNQVHDLDSPLSKREQELNRFREIVDKIAIKRKNSE